MVMANDFFYCWVTRKKGKTFKIGEKTAQKKMGATDQPGYNGFRVIREHVITAFQCTSDRQA